MTNRAELNSSAARKKGGSVGCRLSFLVGHSNKQPQASAVEGYRKK